jgi:hypothetical protein
MCKVKYEAPDGEQFDSREECEKYSKGEWVYIVYALGVSYSSKLPHAIFKNEDVANKCADEMTNRGALAYVVIPARLKDT